MLCEMGADGVRRNADGIERLLRDHGVTYNAFQDAGAAGRPWYLDPLPVIIHAADFAAVERGLQQRIRLYRAIMADVYGPQQLLKQSWIPPRLLYANPGYLRQVCDAMVDDDWIYTLATDLVRSPHGQWMALADRCQMPGGIGYALENRIVMSQAFPREFKDCRVQRLASFFEREREIFREMADVHRHTPHVVMLTSGPFHRSYFEHAFKARYLGFPLVEGADLTVRDRRLFMKTLEGLRQVDVVIRRVEDASCDSLELDAGSFHGVPGLLESWRNGRVKMANRIGSGVMEAAAWLPYLPLLCQKLLGEELWIPSVPTQWCGLPEVWQEVVTDPERWVFKSAYGSSKRPAVSAASLTDARRAELLAEVAANPEAWVVQESLALSNAPVWTGERLEPRPFVWRSFVCGDAQHSYVMPGGLGRVSPFKEGFLVSMGAGAISKDVWVIAENEVLHKSLLAERNEKLRISRPPGDVPSRVVDHLFWLGRYAERMEQTTRVLRMLSKRLGGEGGEMQTSELCAGVKLAQALELLERESASVTELDHMRDQIIDSIYNPKRHDGVADLMEKLRFNAASARDRLSDDTWRLFHLLQDVVRAPLEYVSSYHITTKLDRIVLDLAAFSGMQSENMVKGHGWRFLEMGRRIERATANATFLHAAIALCRETDAILVPLLELFDSSMTYRRHHYAKPKLLPVMDLLMLHAGNPRSLAYQLEALHHQATLLPPGSAVEGAANVASITAQMLATLRHIDLATVNEHQSEFSLLGECCADFVTQLEALSNQLTEGYFSHAARQSR